jgi:peptidoglycan hydrolase CwlO-like protein
MSTPRALLIVRLAAAFVAALLVGALLSGPAIADTKSELAAAKTKLNALLKRIDSAQQRIASLQRQANAIAGRIDQVQSRIANVQAKIVDVQHQIQLAGDELLATQAQLDLRVRTAYENGPAYSLELVLGSTSLSDLTDRLAIVNAAAQSDRQLIEKIQGLQATLRLRQQKLTGLETDLRGQQQELVTQEKDLQAKLGAAQDVLNQLAQDKSDAAALVKKLEAKRAAEVAAYKKHLAELEAARQAASHGGSSIKGVFFVCPVDQPRAYGDDFGAPRFSGGYHPHAGNDIVAPTGTPIRAPFSGTAVVASNDLGGLSVKVYGSLGYVYNAHLSALGSLGSVSTGEIVGYVGSSGDAQGGIAHDHFEWHPDVIPSPLWTSPYGYSLIGSAIDPYPYLNSVC